MAVELHIALAQCDDLVYTVPTGTVEVGDVIAVTVNLTGFALNAGEAGDVITVITRAPIISVPLVVPTAGIAAGTRIYVNPTTGAWGTSSGGSNVLVGTAREDAVLGETRVFVNFDGRR